MNNPIVGKAFYPKNFTVSKMLFLVLLPNNPNVALNITGLDHYEKKPLF